MVREKTNNQKGYIALISLLIVATVGLTISVAVSLRGMEELQISFTFNQAARASALAESCMEEGLNRLRESWVNFNSLNLSIGSNSCIINIVAFDANSATLEANGYIDNYRKKITAVVDYNLDVISWQNN